jgi:hypothetical protein
MNSLHSSRREPGDWSCSQCNEINFKSRTTCRRCSTPRVQPAANQPSPGVAAPQAVPRPGDWTCPFCSNLNFAARIACNKCARPKEENKAANTAAPAILKPGDWKCSSCPEMNFGSRIVCRSCGAARPSTESSSTKGECVICMENPIDSVITSCGHSAVCLSCGAHITQCPICRNPFTQQQLIKFYLVH